MTASDLRQRAFAAHLAENLGAPARAILAYRDLVVEEARELGLDGILPDLDRVSAAAADLNRLIEGLIENGGGARLAAGQGLEARLRHDLRTPLNAIIGYSEMIAEEIADLPHDALKEDLGVILSEAGALLGRIDAIVDLSAPGNAVETLVAAAQASRVAAEFEAAVSRDASQPEVAPGRILVIDDVASNRDLLARRLGRAGHEVVQAASCRAALDLLKGREIDLILLDILMPDMNGIELLGRLKAHRDWRRIPVIMISGLTEIDAVTRCIEAGADDYLAKPFNPVLLRARISACLEKKRWADRERRYLERIEFEKSRADGILHAILPGQVVRRLSSGETVIADCFDSVTILFADLVGFTAVAARTPPERLVQRLDGIFRAFDELARAHGVEKIKTIGDAYMAAAGLPEPSTDHADRILGFGRAMLAALAEFDAHEQPFRLRIGVHTGPAIAGLIGRHRFVYDVWGETVNTASRLEAQSLPGRIQISAATLAALSGGWAVESRGMIELRGIGATEAYLLSP